MRPISSPTLLALILLMSWFSNLRSQAVDWTVDSPGSGIHVSIDNFGNTFNCYQIVGTVNLGPYTFTAAGLQDVIVTKYSPNGALMWATVFGGTMGDFGNKLTFDHQGNIWITGQFSGTLNAGAYTLTSAGGTDAFLVKLSAINGQIVFAERGGSTGNDVGLAVQADASGNIFFSGTFTSNFTFGSTTLAGGGMDVFLLKLNNTGSALWSQKITGSNIETMWTMNIDASGNAYIGGFATSSNTNFGTTPVSMSPSTHFVVKYDNTGNYVWHTTSDFNGEIYGLCTDASGNIYFTGNFDTQITLGPITLTNSGPNDDILLVKMNAAGQYCWARNFGSTGSDQGYDLACDPAGNLFLTGSFQSAFNFGGVNVNGGGNGMAYTAKLDSAGVVQWIVQANSSNLTYGKGIIWSAPEDVYMCGIGSGNMTIGNSTVNFSSGSGFLCRLADHANIITGTVFRDINNDGSLNPGETGVPNTIMQLNTGPYVSSSNNNGVYHMFTAAGNYSVSIPNLPLYHTLSTPTFQTSNFTGMGNVDTAKHFGLYPTPGVNDLRVDVTAVTRPKAGFVLQYMITCTNIGTTTQNAVLNFTGDALINYLSASPTHSSVSGSTYTWNLGPLQPQAITSIHVSYTVPTSAIIGDTILSTANLTPVTNDTTPTDNTYAHQCLVVGPYDPNYKEVSSSTLTPSQLSQNPWLTYTIHFQNIGNDSAQTVIIRDSLSQNLDLSTLQIVAYSHPLSFQITGLGYGEFRFDNIMLPDSMTNPITSCGFVKYRVKPKTSLVPGDSIPNYADIYFDYNPAITTDVITTYILNPAGLQTSTESTFLALYPNPTETSIWVHLPELQQGDYEIKVMSTEGRELKSFSGNAFGNATIQLPVQDLPSGVYFIQLSSENLLKVGRFVKQ